MALSEQELRIQHAVQRRATALLDDLRLHVGIPTGMGHMPGLDETRERLTNRCKALGASVELIAGDTRPDWLDYRAVQRPTSASASVASPPPTAVSRKLGTGVSRKGVLIAGHLDTVHDPAGPFNALTIKTDGKLATGPGCVDMKGGLVIAMHALEVLAEVGMDVPWSFIMNSDEETGSFHSDRALRAEAGSGRYVAGLALEPAMAKGELAIQRGGSGQFVIEAYGRQAHVGRDFAAGASATDALCRAVVAAHQLTDLKAPGGSVCVNVSPLWCDLPTNVVSDRASAWGNVRYPTPDAGAALGERLRSLSGGGDALPRVVVQTIFNRPAKPMTAETEALGLLARSVSEDLGRPLPFGQSAGVCDGNNLQAAGLPTIDTVGVRGGGLHTLDEWIEIESLVERCTMLAVLMSRLTR